MNILPKITRVLLLDNVAPEAAERLQKAGVTVRIGRENMSQEQLIEQIREFTPSAIVLRSATKMNASVIEEACFCVRIIARAGVGVDNVDLEAATKHGILVINAPVGNTLSAIEHSCALIMAIARQLHASQIRIDSKPASWKEAKAMVNSPLHKITEVSEKTLGIIGLGRIGSGVGARMHAFGMRVIGYDPGCSLEKINSYQKWLSYFCSLDEIWRQSDYISLHVPLSPSTYHLIDETVLNRCRRGVRIINCCRGGIVDEKALLSSLESGKCKAAAFDVFEQEPPSCDGEASILLRHPNVIATPHVGGSSEESQTRVAFEVVDAILSISGLSDEKELTGLENAVNLNENGIEIRKILNNPMFCEDFLQQYRMLCELTTVGGLFSLHTYNETFGSDEIESFLASLSFNIYGSDSVNNSLGGILKSLLRDLLFKEEHIFPDALKALVRNSSENFSKIFHFQDLDELEIDLRNHQFCRNASISMLSYLRISCQGSANQKILLGYGLIENENKEKVVYLFEKCETILSDPYYIGNTNFIDPIDFNIFE